MSKKNNFKNHKYLIPFAILIFLVLIVNGELNSINKEILIETQDEVYEGTNFSISIFSFENGTINQIKNLTITFNNISYFFSNNQSDIILTAPIVDRDTIYAIKVEKIGYNETIVNILVLNEVKNISQLFITVLDDNFIIEGNSYISILITDEIGIKIPDAMVAIQGYIGKDTFYTTDNNGIAKILIPNDRDEIILIAQKSDYINGFEKIYVNIDKGYLNNLRDNQLLFIFFALIILIISIIIVSKRKKNNFVIKKEDLKHKKEDIPIKKSDTSNKNIKESKIEEITINKKSSNNKITNLSINENKKIKFNKNPNKNNQFYMGLDEIRNRIDHLDEIRNMDSSKNWFEGEKNIKLKINKKIKEKKVKK